MKKVSLFIAVAIFVLSGCGFPKIKYPVNKNAQNAIDSISYFVDQNHIPVLQYKYISPGLKLEGVRVCGDTTFVIDQVVNENSIFQAASLSKPVFSYIVMKMVDAGEIDLDTPVAEYTDIDRFKDKEMAMKLTPRIVLSHQTGLPNWAVGPSSDEWPTSEINFKYPADSCFAYSGEGYAFLQRAVEKIKGKSLDAVARELVFDPLDMPNTSYAWLPQYDTLAVAGFNSEGVNRGQGRHPRENSAYTLRTNATEYSKFLVALMNGDGLSPEIHKEMFTPQVHAQRYAYEPRECDSTVFWCLGFGSVKEDYFWHWGDNGNFKALWYMHPATKEIFIYFTDSANGHDFLDPFLEMMTGEKLPLNDWINN